VGPGWLVAHAKYSRVDPGDQGGEPQLNELDYALIRLASPVGDSPGQTGTAKRGWVSVSATPPVVQPNDILFIVQHPNGEPLKLAVGAVLERNRSGTRVRYDANTQPGSSGSPCFDAKLDLIALHHAGDPAWKHPPRYNQGIPIERIVDQLADRRISQFWT